MKKMFCACERMERERRRGKSTEDQISKLMRNEFFHRLNLININTQHKPHGVNAKTTGIPYISKLVFFFLSTLLN